jgi:uncharacterized protein
MKGDWIQTYTGKQFWPLDPQIVDIDIRDIAHALSMICRFTGHCEKFYSVAEHSIRVSEILPNDLKLYGLLHDASEAYLSDVARPLKMLPMFSEYRIIEKILQEMIYIRYGLDSQEPEKVKEADNILLFTEARDLMKTPPASWRNNSFVLLPKRIEPTNAEDAEKEFLKIFFELYIKIT